MRQGFIALLIPYITDLFTRGLADDLDVSFKNALVNDLKNHQNRIAYLATSMFITLLLVAVAITFLAYGAAQGIVGNMETMWTAFMTCGFVIAAGAVTGGIFYANLQFLISRVEAVKNAITSYKTLSPWSKLFEQVKEEQRMFLEAFERRRRSTEEPYIPEVEVEAAEEEELLEAAEEKPAFEEDRRMNPFYHKQYPLH